MAISLADNFSYSGAKPNFERDSYATLADMVSVNENFLPDVFIGVCKETGKAYLFNKSNEVDPTLGKWRELGTGQLTDVQVYGDSKVTNKIANLKVVEQIPDFSALPIDGHELDYLGRIAQYTGETDELYTNGYFYQYVLIDEESTLTATSSNPELIITADKESYESQQSTQVDAYFELTYTYYEDSGDESGGEYEWEDPLGQPVDISTLGITIEGEPQENDTLIVEYKKAVYEYRWDPINVQKAGTDEHFLELIGIHNVDPDAHANIVSSLNAYIEHVEEEKQDLLKEGEHISIEEDGTINVTDLPDPGTRDYNELSNKPAIDGVTLTSTTTKEDLGLGGIFVFKGTVADLAALAEIQNPSVGDVYFVTSENGQYAWDGTAWDPIGSSVSVNRDNTLEGTGSEASPLGISKDVMASLVVPDTSTMTLLSSKEFDMSSTGYYRFLTIPNTYTTLTSLNGSAIFRITITGSGINTTIEGVVSLRQRISEAPYIVMRHKTGTKSAAYTGTRYMRLVYPKALNNGGDWAFDLRPYNATARHVKVEVFKTEPSFVWNQGEIGTYTSSKQTYTNLILYTNDGIVGSSTLYWNANTATSAGYLTSYLPKFVSGGTMPLCGEQIPAHGLMYMSTDGKLYPSSNLIKEIDPEFGIQLCEVTTKANAAIAYTSLRQKEAVTSLTQIPHDTLTRGAPCYLRCTTLEDTTANRIRIYSNNYVTTEITKGFTWYYIGIAASATAINIDTTQSFFITINADGDMSLLNGKTFDAYTKKDMDEKIELLQAGSDVRDIVKNYEELLAYDTSQLLNRDVIEILEDEEHEGTATYYRWIIDEENPQGHWVYLGERGPYYTKRQSNDLIRNAVAAEATLRENADDNLQAQINGLAKYGIHSNYQFNIPEADNVEEGLLLFIENPALEYMGSVTTAELPTTGKDNQYYLVDNEKYAVWENSAWVYYNVLPGTTTLSTKYDLYINKRHTNYYAYDIESLTYHPYGTSVIYTDSEAEFDPVYLIYPDTDEVQQSTSVVYSKNAHNITEIASTIAPYAYKDEADNICYWTEKIEDYETGPVELDSMRDSTHEVIYVYDEEDEIYEILPIIYVDRENNTVSDSKDNIYTRFPEADKLYSCFEYADDKIWVLGDVNDSEFTALDKLVYRLNEFGVLEVTGLIVEEYDSENKVITIEEGDSYPYTEDPKVLDIFECIGRPNRNRDLFTLEWTQLSNYGGSGKVTADKVEYHNPSYPTVEAALDKLLYVKPTVSISGSDSENEKGSSVASYTINWSWSKTPVSQKINIGSTSITLDTNVRTYTYTPENPITSDIEFTISGSDGTTNVTSNKRKILFYDRYYYGSSVKANLTDSEIIAMNPTYIKASRSTILKSYGPYTNYIYLVFPTSECVGIKFFTGAGFQTNDFLLTTKDITNSSGRTLLYNIYRFKSDRPYETPESIRASYTN